MRNGSVSLRTTFGVLLGLKTESYYKKSSSECAVSSKKKN